MKWDMTKVVEEIVTQCKETEEEFVFETIRPYCENILQLKINKEELNRIILRGVRPNGKWIKDNCSICGYGVRPWNNTPYCPNCGAEMEVE